MTDNEIIKALECCKEDDCDNCPNTFGNCYANLVGYALGLINRQQAEIKRLTINMNAFGLGMIREKEKADTIRTEAIKEFADLSIKTICEKVSAPTPSESYKVEKCIEVIDTLVKEMVGD